MMNADADERQRRFKLKASSQVLKFELLMHGFMIVASIGHLGFHDGLLFAILIVLLAIRFFRNESVIVQYRQPVYLDVRPTSDRLIWQQGESVIECQLSEVKIYLTRWFILLKLQTGESPITRLLLEDSFEQPVGYRDLRRTLIEHDLC